MTHLRQLVRQLQLPVLTARYPPRLVLGLFALINGLVAIGLLSVAAWATGSLMVMPSLGPTAFMVFSTPLTQAACPRNILGGHLLGAVTGYAALALTGLTHEPSALAEGFSPERAIATAVSLGLTSGLMIWLRVVHPPAGATTLIVSLGLLTRPSDLAVLLVAVLLLALQALAINRLAGIRYPWWGGAAP